MLTLKDFSILTIANNLYIQMPSKISSLSPHYIQILSNCQNFKDRINHHFKNQTTHHLPIIFNKLKYKSRKKNSSNMLVNSGEKKTLLNVLFLLLYLMEFKN